MPRPSILALALVLLGLAPVAAAQSTFHALAGSAPGGDGSCSRPFATVGDALAAARAGGAPARIRLAGSFREAGLVLDVSGLTIEGGFDGAAMSGACTDATLDAARSIATFPTTIDADLDADGKGEGRIFDVPAGTADVVLDGLTLVRGRAGGSAGPLAPRDGSGGALRILNAQRIRVSRCTFRGNQTTQHQSAGGAIFIAGSPVGGVPGAASLQLADDVFESNGAGDGATGSASGGAVGAWDFNVSSGLQGSTFVDARDCTFSSNFSRGSGPLDAATWCIGWDNASPPAPNNDCAPRDGVPDRCASRAVGGAVSLIDVGGTWERNDFGSNFAAGSSTGAADYTGQGGAFASANSIVAPPGPQPILTHNVFHDNLAVAGAGNVNGCGAISGWGGAAYLVNFTSRVEGNLFENNVADATRATNTSLQVGDGGAVALVGQGTVLLDGNTFRGNQALAGRGAALAGSGGGLYVQDGFAVTEPIVTNNLFESNLADGSVAATGYGGGIFMTTAGNVLVARNRISDNEAAGTEGVIAGIGGAAYLQLLGGLVADNVVTGNRGNNAAGGGFDLRFGGLSFIAAAAGDPALSPRVQNNLVYGNQGTGVSAVGFPSDLDGDGVTTVPDEVFYCSPVMIHDTIVLNSGPALCTNQSDEMIVDGGVLWGNDTAATGTGEWYDGFLGTVSAGVLVRHSVLSNWNVSIDATVRDPAHANQLGVDPQFVDAPAADFHLRQRPDQGTGAVSTLVDAGFGDASATDYGPGTWDQRFDGVARPYDGDGVAGADTLAGGTTRSVTGLPDEGIADVGYHYALSPPADTDGDGLLDGDEVISGLDPLDADSDDDGLRDGDELLADTDGDGAIDAADCDADGDGLVDGLERGVLVADGDTDVAAACAGTGGLAFVRDGDASTVTSAVLADTDGDGCADGAEDADHDGVVDGGESDPLDPAGCAPPVMLRINDAIAALSGGAPSCGPATVPPLALQVDASGSCAEWSGCSSPSVRPTSTIAWTGTPIVLAGAAAAGTSALALYEIDGCPGTLVVSRRGADVVVEAR